MSSAQTDEMAASDLQLILPEGLHATYAPSQQHALMSLDEFIQLVRDRNP
ncbi:MAG: type II restriction endonuclease [Oceanicaulis sp.]